MNERELQHSGVIGMRWGRRLYQNKDGTYTALGKARRRKGGYFEVGAGGRASHVSRSETKTSGKSSNSESGEGSKYSRLFDPSIKRGKDKAPMSPAESMSKEAQNIDDRINNIYKRGKAIKDSSKSKESKGLSDEELKKRISRLELEHRYDRLRSEDIEKGRITAGDILDSVGDVLAIGTSAIVLYTAWKHR